MPTHSAGDPAQTSPCRDAPGHAACRARSPRRRPRARRAAGCCGRRCGRGRRRGSGRRAACRRRSTSPRGRRPGSTAQSAPSVAHPVIGTVVRRSTLRPDPAADRSAYSAAQRVPAERPDPEHRREPFARPQLQVHPPAAGVAPGRDPDPQQPHAEHEHQHPAGRAGQQEVADDDRPPGHRAWPAGGGTAGSRCCAGSPGRAPSAGRRSSGRPRGPRTGSIVVRSRVVGTATGSAPVAAPARRSTASRCAASARSVGRW